MTDSTTQETGCTDGQKLVCRRVACANSSHRHNTTRRLRSKAVGVAGRGTHLGANGRLALTVGT
jgi:hypothetical protein